MLLPRPLRFGLALVPAVVVVLLTGCSSDSGSSNSGSSNSSAGTSSTEPTRASSGSTPGSDPTATGFTLTSSAFADGASIPTRYACTNLGGENVSPPLAWTGVPAGTATLVLVVHDPDAPRAGGFTHLVTTIPVATTSLDAAASTQADSPMARWIGPCPPSGEHHYEFTLYAFGPDTTVPATPDKAAIDAIAGAALGRAELTGLFAKPA